MKVLASLPHLQNVVNLGHSVEFPVLQLLLRFRVICCIRGNQFRVSACQNPVNASSKQPYNDLFAKGSAFGCLLPPANNMSAKGKTVFNYDAMWYDKEHVLRHVGGISVL